DLVFNLCEGVHGKSEWEEHVVGSLEFAGVPVTGASLWTIAACRRKAVANALLAQAGLPIPRWTIAQGNIDDDFPLPAIVKPAAVPRKLADKLVKLAEAAWRGMQGKGYGRVDLRVDEQGRPWVLDVNPNPDLNDDAGLSRMAKAAGWDYAELVRRVAEVAL